MYIATKRDEGVFNRASLRYIRDSFKIGQAVKVKRKDGRGRDKYFIGTAIEKTEYFVVVRNKTGYREDFNYVDFLTRDVEVV